MNRQQHASFNFGNDPQNQFQSANFAGLRTNEDRGSSPPSNVDDMQFDIFNWYPKYQSCQRYFINYSQHSGPVQALAAFINILLPFQRQPNPVMYYSTPPAGPAQGVTPLGVLPPSTLPSIPTSLGPPLGAAVSLVPFLRRLVVTGLDFPGVLHGFFGDDWAEGVGPLYKQERRNYLFAAKSGGWAAVKQQYDISPHETVPFMRPLQNPEDAEISAAEKAWSEWLCNEDWMLGPRAPDGMQ